MLKLLLSKSCLHVEKNTLAKSIKQELLDFWKSVCDTLNIPKNKWRSVIDIIMLLVVIIIPVLNFVNDIIKEDENPNNTSPRTKPMEMLVTIP